MKVVAFDLDGTLLDSRLRHRVLLDDILKMEAIKIDTSDLIEFKRKGKNNVDFMISKGITRDKAIKIQEKWIAQIEDAKYLSLDSLYPQTKDLLAQYKNCELFLITARANKNATLKQISELGLLDYFKDIFVVSNKENVIRSKAEYLLKIKASLMIGDTEIDYFAAKEVGCAFQYAPFGFREKDFLLENSK